MKRDHSTRSTHLLGTLHHSGIQQSDDAILHDLPVRFVDVTEQVEVNDLVTVVKVSQLPYAVLLVLHANRNVKVMWRLNQGQQSDCFTYKTIPTRIRAHN